MRLSRIIILVSLLFLPAHLMAESSLQIETAPRKELNFYPWITFMSRGPIHWLGENSTADVTGLAYRVVVITAEIYNRVFIEEITNGEEGCCVKVVSIRELNLEKLYRHFGFKGEISGFKIIEWKSNISFEFAIHYRHFLLTDADQGKVTIKELKRGSSLLLTHVC